MSAIDEQGTYTGTSDEATQQILSINNFEKVKQNPEITQSITTTQNAQPINYTDVPTTKTNISTPQTSESQMEILTTIPDKNNNNTKLLQGGSTDNKQDNNNNDNNNDDDNDDKDEVINIHSNSDNAISNEVTEEVDGGEDKEKEAGDTESETEMQYGGGSGSGSGSGSDDRTYEIDYLVGDDKELINIDKVNSIVNKYINNFYSEEMKKYKQSFKQLYQKYSNKRFVINNIGNVITVIRNEKKKDVVMELKKPVYFYYNNINTNYNNDNDNLEILKRNISNERANLQYLYQHLVNKVSVENDAKKDFEKKRKKFIELLDTYYIYTLYHKKINKISIENKMNIIIQDLLSESKKLESNIYSIDTSTIDLINKNNASKLNEFNNLVAKMQSVKKIQNEKILIEKIKEYLNKAESNKLLNTLKEQAKYQEEYIEYIVKELP
jgi:hypothetical protein